MEKCLHISTDFKWTRNLYNTANDRGGNRTWERTSEIAQDTMKKIQLIKKQAKAI